MKLTLLRHSLAGLLFAFPLTQTAFSQDKKDDKKPDDKKEEPKPDDKKEDGKPDDKKEDKEKEDEDEKDEIINSEEQAKFPLDSLLTGKAEVWKLTPDEVEKTFKKAGFKWLETGKKERGLLRPRRLLMKKESGKSNSYTVTKTSYTLFTGAESAAEVNFEFKTGALAAVNISVWNKGDSDEIVEVAFKKKIDNVIAGLNTNMAVKGRDMGRDMASAAKAFRYRWENPGTMAQLEYSLVSWLRLFR